MKTIVVLSDTHGNVGAMESIRKIMNENDYVFHLGDYQRDIKLFSRELGEKLHSVKGNCDLGSDEEILDIEGVKILITHGNAYGVKGGLNKLFYRAKEIGANLVFYGHTHQARIDEEDGVTMVNPGSMTRYAQKSYCYCVLHQGKITCQIVNF